MKYILPVLLIILCTLCVLGISEGQTVANANCDFLRIHIRANSNELEDQRVKYEIKNAFVDYLIPLFENVQTKEDVMLIISANKTSLENVANNILKTNGLDYVSNVKLNNEEFPTRVYNNITLESGFYDAVIVELGEADGDNWWCVIYPPLCFANYNSSSVNVVYKSKIMEIINKFFNWR